METDSGIVEVDAYCDINVKGHDVDDKNNSDEKSNFFTLHKTVWNYKLAYTTSSFVRVNSPRYGTNFNWNSVSPATLTS